MNVKPIKGHANLETLNKVCQSIGSLTPEELEQQCEYLKSGIKAARGKITNAVNKQRAAKWIIRRRTTLPSEVVRQALINQREAKEAEVMAAADRDRFIQQYRNFRSFIYIQKSVEQLLAAAK